MLKSPPAKEYKAVGRLPGNLGRADLRLAGVASGGGDFDVKQPAAALGWVCYLFKQGLQRNHHHPLDPGNGIDMDELYHPIYYTGFFK